MSRGLVFGLVALGGLNACGPTTSADREVPPGVGGVLRMDARPASTTNRDATIETRSRTDDASASASTDAAVPIECRKLAFWKAGSPYQPDDRVRHGAPAHTYKCRPWPHGLWCAMTKYEPADEPGVWADAWIDEGVCL
jgi:hypothetical protein